MDVYEKIDRQLEYIQKLEKRIHNQRAQLKWWNTRFIDRKIVPKGSSRWKASDVTSLLRRMKTDYRIGHTGSLYKIAKPRRKED